ncbi:alpha-isopropylmalate synthase regulatory domain-containing protein [Tsukamurella sp. 8F]|uniref:alpha-isopropylmalate synthase regulatory domain-containing protein n=1 Tax=unclassified Tsukamurella TaxID=2633480 RepID=UPI0023B9C053|nr:MULTISPECIES: alpha-isopropylmalate synthase regulatory domain-containing protein [unclassified Tsukamurella]MDF0529532.1 alpha-isopropylmalate synthase regulatory domain-containing protein [Tsukamurella sp. 8J]MDF0585780.1 alpha-isopropylmalate synthase regulatory domain-containing protein [Tsukamurella sp. 8F]
MTTPTSIDTDCPFSNRYHQPLPRGLREAARGMSWEDFRDAYAPPADLAVDTMTCRHAPDGSVQLTVGLRRAGTRMHLTAEGAGPVAATTALLYRLGRPVEVLEFHQLAVAEGTATFLRTGDGRTGRQHWNFAIAHDPDESAARALVGAATRD